MVRERACKEPLRIAGRRVVRKIRRGVDEEVRRRGDGLEHLGSIIHDHGLAVVEIRRHSLLRVHIEKDAAVFLQVVAGDQPHVAQGAFPNHAVHVLEHGIETDVEVRRVDPTAPLRDRTKMR